jgi:hypothetical protein
VREVRGPDGQGCASCAYSGDLTPDDAPAGTPTFLVCRRFPPQGTQGFVIAPNGSAATPGQFPSVDGDDWCGEWAAP